MKILYKFADGTTSEVEVSEDIGAFITASRREEANYNRKCRYHTAASLDAMEFEGDIFADDSFNPEILSLFDEEQSQVDAFMALLTDKQRQRVQGLMEGKTISQIAREEGISHKAVADSIKQIQEKYKKFF